MTAPIELSPLRTPVQLGSVKDFRLVSTCVAWNSDAIRMFVAEEALDAVFETTKSQGASFPKTHTEQNYIAKICVSSSEKTWVCDLPLVSATFPIVQTLPDENILVVAPRCSRNQDGTHEYNARIYDRIGALTAEFCFGDGIEHVQTDHAGNIWVGYFDEGVFGNFGWGDANGAEPIGSAGLVRFDRNGKKAWEYQPPDGVDSICDCYALNVSSGAVWACYYTEFPIIRIDADGRIDSWQTELSGIRHIAVNGTSVLAFGGYGDTRGNSQLLRLEPGHAVSVAAVRLNLSEDVRLDTCTVIGRDSMLHVFTPTEWYSFAVPDAGIP